MKRDNSLIVGLIAFVVSSGLSATMYALGLPTAAMFFGGQSSIILPMIVVRIGQHRNGRSIPPERNRRDG